jgi:hypothetical protein
MGIKLEMTPEEMSLAALAECSARELGKYRRKEPSNDRYCLEIFRRAVILGENEAWGVLRQLLGESMRQWLGRNPYREAALRHEVERTHMDDAFSRFWKAVSDQKMQFDTLAGALKYLHLCLSSAVLDTLRTYSRPHEEALPDYGHPDEPLVEDSYAEGELWDIIKSVLPNQREQRLAELLFFCNLKPRQVVALCPSEFQDENEIYRLKRNIVDRIMRNKDKIKWRLEGWDRRD